MSRITIACLLICVLPAGCPDAGDKAGDNASTTNRLLIFHNGSGPMCVEALAWLDVARAEHPGLLVESHLTTQASELTVLAGLKTEYGQSEGVSASFGYLPIIFYQGRAFSGFNDEIRDALGALMISADAGT